MIVAMWFAMVFLIILVGFTVLGVALWGQYKAYKASKVTQNENALSNSVQG